MYEKIFEHPSYGQIELTRTSCGAPVAMYGSSINHSELIHITVYKSKNKRSLSKNWYFTKSKVVDLYMTQAQFAEFVTSAGMGGGVPCTLNYIIGEGHIDGPAPVNTAMEFRSDLEEQIKTITGHLDTLIKKVKSLMDKKAVSKKDKEELLSDLNQAKMGLESNIPYIGGMFEEHMEKTVMEAKGTLEAYIQNKALQGDAKLFSIPEIEQLPNLPANNKEEE